MARWVKVFREGRDAVQDNFHKGRLHGGDHIGTRISEGVGKIIHLSIEPPKITITNNPNTVQFLASLLDADHRWTVSELATEVGVAMSQKLCSTLCTTF